MFFLYQIKWNRMFLTVLKWELYYLILFSDIPSVTHISILEQKFNLV